jgi:Uma2 family endonuclease
MTTAEKYLPHYTYDDYMHWEGRWELLEGHPIAMSPMPIPKHQRAVIALSFELELALRQVKCKQCKVYDALDYKVKDDTILQPDLLVLCKPTSKKYIDFPPAFVAEIFSPSTVLRDRNTKFEIYQQQGVKYYLMVDADKEVFYLYVLQGDKYQLVEQDFNESYSFEFEEGCKAAIVLNQVWENL